MTKTSEVGREQWRQFCEQVNQSSRGALVSIRLQEADGTTTTVVEQAPLRSLALDEQSDACNDLLVIEAGLPDTRPVAHRVIEPLYIRLQQEANRRVNHMQILAENGVTLLDFFPGLSQEAFEKLAA